MAETTPHHSQEHSRERNVWSLIRSWGIILAADPGVTAKGNPPLEGAAVQSLQKPAEWWKSFGVCTPHLTRMAIQILSLTCSACGCERSWSVFEGRLNDLVFVKYNSILEERYNFRDSIDPIALGDLIEDSNEWLTGEYEEDEVPELDEGTSRTRALAARATPTPSDLISPYHALGAAPSSTGASVPRPLPPTHAPISILYARRPKGSRGVGGSSSSVIRDDDTYDEDA